MFKAGDTVIITMPEDHRKSPGFNRNMHRLLVENNFKIVLGRNTNKDRGWWRTSTNCWTWSEAWMSKVNKFKGNK